MSYTRSTFIGFIVGIALLTGCGGSDASSAPTRSSSKTLPSKTLPTTTVPPTTVPPTTIPPTTTTRTAAVRNPVYAPTTTVPPAVTGGNFPIIAIPGLGTGTRTDLTGGAIRYQYGLPEGMSLQAACEAGVQGVRAAGYDVGQLFCEATGTAAFGNAEFIGQLAAETYNLNVFMRRR